MMHAQHTRGLGDLASSLDFVNTVVANLCQEASTPPSLKDVAHQMTEAVHLCAQVMNATRCNTVQHTMYACMSDILACLIEE
jgi:hypothetical protein